ncbi:MAG: bifunctional glutamate N-acetyltransferase/amino-acid acetyltransferase ArgJ [Gammaproteobacteria bacterium]|nr:bifunctional glutamate N-acetyltransferase/amino-acid acetyltransferase ArgJ [Gammaproteobacteria bacterium]
MAVNLTEPTQVHAIEGVRLATASAGIRYLDRDDLVLIEIAQEAKVAAVFTQNKFRAAPVSLSVDHLNKITPRYLIINAGNANAGTGQIGMNAALDTTKAVAESFKVTPEQVLPFSTGVIGEVLDASKITNQLSCLKENLSCDNWLLAAKAIMTTDTVSKAYSKKINIAGKDIQVTGIAKGSGMIQPNMATMLSYIATDLDISNQMLQELLSQATEQSFNSITVDSDTSTNDACVLIATGKSGVIFDEINKEDKNQFQRALYWVMQMLAQAIVRDGEGATKFVTVCIEKASNQQQAKSVAYSVANSPLVKTAFSASDPNWGRIMAAAGKCNDYDLQLSQASLSINNVPVMERGELATSYTERLGKQAMQSEEIEIIVQLNLGQAQHTVWTTDLTHEYVSINADYRS